MEIEGKVVVVTGAASGIGRSMARRFATEGAKAVVVSDLNEEGATKVASEIVEHGGNSVAIRTDVGDESQVVALIDRATEAFGPIDLFCSNAGIATIGGAEAPDLAWLGSWQVNVMAHVFAARRLIPEMAERGHGYLLNTASAAGLLTNLGTAPYAVTKHAAVAFAEWLAITHHHQGIRVSCLCPQGVRTPMLMAGMGIVDEDSGDPSEWEPMETTRVQGEGGGQDGDPIPGSQTPEGGLPTKDAVMGASAVLASGGLLEPADVARSVVRALREEQFLILPHPEVAKYFRNRANDHERWLSGMRKMQSQLMSI